ncbi:GSCFA domain-containing protein [Nitrosomonas sp. Nm33]|uniref:GSCFA domain-containing protein n=1 Tax=Nitrosomonas sp. Nm33 TaxID=133724 RepID=UPI0008966CFF|nr:GSCFA domain-containing protein [Nitrosomonas sp. Nm33]SDZ13409.1 GSCFA family protein [Nitrosomonas sp. Nm33]
MTHPYKSLPDSAYWRRAVASVLPANVDPVMTVPFRISPQDRVATAGSCFAQHIARYLRNNGFNFFVTEEAHPLFAREMKERYNYELFTARYGNIYTTRQLLQLFQRAYGRFRPMDDAWYCDDGSIIDPFRPQIQPSGFTSWREYELDRSQHFAAVRRAFEELDIFVFTLGLTECWVSREDGAAYPLCPGVAGGRFDPRRHEFVNFGVDEVTADMLAFIDLLREINPALRVILTVSPVPLIATMEPQHVLVSTTYSKSVLRVAAETVVHARANVAYFPSYEIITGSFSRGKYFGEDCRLVTEEGVSHVMRVFLKHFTNFVDETKAKVDSDLEAKKYLAEMEQIIQVMCDEEALDKH